MKSRQEEERSIRRGRGMMYRLVELRPHFLLKGSSMRELQLRTQVQILLQEENWDTQQHRRGDQKKNPWGAPRSWRSPWSRHREREESAIPLRWTRFFLAGVDCAEGHWKHYCKASWVNKNKKETYTCELDILVLFMESCNTWNMVIIHDYDARQSNEDIRIEYGIHYWFAKLNSTWQG